MSDLGYLYDSGGGSGGGDGGGDSGVGTPTPELDPITSQAFERRIQKLERENKELTRKLQGMYKHIQVFTVISCKRHPASLMSPHAWISACPLKYVFQSYNNGLPIDLISNRG